MALMANKESVTEKHGTWIYSGLLQGIIFARNVVKGNIVIN